MAVLVKPEFKGAHWYTRDGRAMHEVPRAKEKDGEKMRATTLADAKKLGLFPSVTGIMDDVLRKLQLERWKINQVILATARVSRGDEESIEYWAKRVVQEANQQVDDAADLGTKTHHSLDAVIHDMSMDRCHPDVVSYIYPVLGWFAEKSLDIYSKEMIVVNEQDGYAGTLDLAGAFSKSDTRKFVFDYKTRKTKVGEEVKAYEYQVCQIAAYAKVRFPDDFAQGRCYGGNLFISSTEPGRIEFVRYTPEEMIEAYNIFRCCTTIWRYIKKFDPRKVEPKEIIDENGKPHQPELGYDTSPPEVVTPPEDTENLKPTILENVVATVAYPTRDLDEVLKSLPRVGMTNMVAIAIEVGTIEVFYKTLAKFIEFHGVLLAIHRPIKKNEQGLPRIHKGKWSLTCPLTGRGIKQFVDMKNPGNSQGEWLQHAEAWIDLNFKERNLVFKDTYNISLKNFNFAPDTNLITSILE